MADIRFRDDIWAVVPAAGRGVRMASGTSKQYMLLRGRTVLEATVRRLAEASIHRIVVAVSPEDDAWRGLRFEGAALPTFVTGGRIRAESVLNGVNYVAERASPDSWVMVHDAVRPCVRVEEIGRLIAGVEQSDVGGLLATPVTDTLKVARAIGAGGAPRSALREVESTAERSRYWAAQTPQLFRLELLREGLARALAQGREVTDEAAAVELLGYAPVLVAGRGDNIKITTGSDLALAEYLLAAQEEETGAG